jgi:hypothetical protein
MIDLDGGGLAAKPESSILARSRGFHKQPREFVEAHD